MEDVLKNIIFVMIINLKNNVIEHLIIMIVFLWILNVNWNNVNMECLQLMKIVKIGIKIVF